MDAALKLAYSVFVRPFIALWDAIKGPVTTFFNWIGGVVKAGMDAALKLAYSVFVMPWVDLWNKVLREPVTAGIKWIQDTWQGISKFFTENVTTPITKAWTTVTEFLPKAVDTAKTAIVSVFTSIGDTIKSILNSIVGGVVRTVNKVINEINYLINRANEIAAKVDGPQIPTLPKLSVPEFAQGGVVTGPTLALVGEAGPEYIIPEGKMAAASANYLNGARGGAVIPAFANGGFAGATRSGAAASSPAIRDSGNAQINITTGPVYQLPDGTQTVSLADLQYAMQATAKGVLSSLRNPSTRISLGLA